MRDSVYLKFFVIENQRHAGQLVYQWLLREASTLGLPGGSAFRAVAGFGRHHVLRTCRGGGIVVVSLHDGGAIRNHRIGRLTFAQSSLADDPPTAVRISATPQRGCVAT